MPKPKKYNPIHLMLLDPDLAMEKRIELLQSVAANPAAENKAILGALLEGNAGQNTSDEFAQKLEELNQFIKQMMEGPLRNAVFLRHCQVNGSASRHALVVLDDGTQAYTTVPDAMLAGTLRAGDRVILDTKGRALLMRAEPSRTGEIATLERWVDEHHVEVNGRGDDRCVLFASQTILDKARAGQAAPGARLVINSKQATAFDVLPPVDGFSHYRYLVKSPAPDVIVERDIGAPAPCIERLASYLRIEMLDPESRRRYQLPRCSMTLLAGTSGSGKTLSVHAIWYRMYEIMSEATGVPVAQLPPRVCRLRLSEVLSKWLGQSDKNLDRFFTEVEQLADEPFVAPDGKRHQLPVLAIMEEIDGLARARGQDSIHDRILTGALERLDSTRPELRGRFIIFLGTTNEAHLLDRAFVRRIGGTIEHFPRLNRKGTFVAVLQKHLNRLPLFANNGCTPAELQRKMLADVAAWLFSLNGADRGLVELTYAGSATPQVRHRRDFLTPALVDRAVRQAAEETCRAESLGGGARGVKFESVVRALDEQIRSVVDQLTEHNAREYTDVPDGVRVATVRRLPRPSPSALELQRG